MRKRVEDYQSLPHTQNSGRLRHETLLLAQIHDCLQKPLDQRCIAIRKMIEEFSIEDLHLLYPHLLGNIFGYITSKSWCLHSPYSRSYEGLRHFLGPQGIIWKLVEKLEKDTFLKYDFPFSYLPKSSKEIFNQGHIPNFYHNKVQSSANQLTPIINLGAMDFFLFHFSYFITQPSSQTTDIKSFERSHETVYSAVLTDYLEYFLPTTYGLATSTERYASTPYETRKHFHSTAINQQGMLNNTILSGLIKSYDRNKTTSCATHFDHNSSQLVKSERFLQIVVEFWLNHIISHERSSPSLFVQNYFLPNIDHVRVVRMLVKHYHTFTHINMKQYHRESASEIINEFHRSFMPDSLKLFKKSLYHFIQHCFAQWPLDSSFKFILETWLSYIQPWRYSLQNQTTTQPFSQYWVAFIHHNLLFYTVIFQEFLSRAEKLNLRSSRDTQLFYRVVKVFSQKSLMTIINEIEGDLITCLSSAESHLRSHSPRSPKSAEFVHFTELWNVGNFYKPLFCQQTVTDICHLLRHCRSTMRFLREPENKSTSKPQNTGWLRSSVRNVLCWIQDVFSIDETSWLLQDENLKAQKNLQYIYQHLKAMFQISDEDLTGAYQSELDGNMPISEVQSSVTTPDCVETDGELVLTALGKYQIANGIRRFDIQYSGDPDFQPVRSYEVASAVRFLYKLSTKLNEKYGPQLKDIYYSSGWFGYVARHVSPGVKSPHTLSPVKHDRVTCVAGQPKISLRFLASTRLWAQVLLFMFLFIYILNKPYFATFALIFVLLVTFLRHINVTKRPQRQRQHATDYLSE